jgi:hypothetical protein
MHTCDTENKQCDFKPHHGYNLNMVGRFVCPDPMESYASGGVDPGKVPMLVADMEQKKGFRV